MSRTLSRARMHVESCLTSDEALVVALADDLDAAFESLAHAWEQRLFAFALRMTGRPRDAEDLAEETLTQAWRALVDYPPERRRALRLRPWLFQIAANLARNHSRSLRRHETISLDAQVSEEATSVAVAAERIADEDPLGNPELALARQQRLADLSAALLTLPEPQRVVIVLRHMEGLGYAAIAEVTGEPVGTVKSHASRGVVRLRRELERQIIAEAQEAVS